MELTLADLFELVVDEVPDATAMVAGGHVASADEAFRTYLGRG